MTQTEGSEDEWQEQQKQRIFKMKYLAGLPDLTDRVDTFAMEKSLAKITSLKCAT